MLIEEKVISEIEKLISEIKHNKGIKNEIIRDDVFSILQALENTNVLYYPLGDEAEDGCDGCHLEKLVNGNIEQFVFINTSNTRERQAFSVAHELGHIWRVDDKIRKLFPDMILSSEDIVNRFAAELLMPRDLFSEAVKQKLLQLDTTMNSGSMSIKLLDLVRLIAYLMNEFFVPYKSVVYRFNETKLLNPQYNVDVLEFKNHNILYGIIKEEQYTRLNIINKLKSMDNLPGLLELAEKEKLFNTNKLEYVRDKFDIDKISEVSQASNDIIFG